MMMPTTPPAASIASGISIRRVIASVVTTAIAIPTMPNRLPRRAVRGCDRPLSERIKRTLAAR